MSIPSLSVILPAFDEERRLRKTLAAIGRYLQERSMPFELIVVDDGSTDRTLQIARRFAGSASFPVRVFHHAANRGKGYCVREGMLKSRAPLALLTDSDLSTPIGELPKLLAQVEDNQCAIAFGSRDVAGSLVEIRQSWLRESSGKCFNRMVQLLTGLPFRDTQCGFKLFDLKQCRGLFELQRIDRFAFDVEILYIARKWRLKMAEVPVCWRHAQGSKVRFAADAPRMLLDLCRIRWNDWKGLYPVTTENSAETNRRRATPALSEVGKTGGHDD